MEFLSPEELFRKMQERHDHAQMHAQEDAHTQQALIDSLDLDQLKVLSNMILNASVSPTMAGFLHGLITARTVALGDCICGTKHETVDEVLKEHIESDQRNLRESIEDQMKEWDLWIDGQGILRCTGCGLQYQSLSDRQLKPKGVDGCHGCQSIGGQGGSFGPTP